MSNYHHFTFINMTKNSRRNYEDGYKLDYQEDYNDGDKIRERMDQQFSEARMRTRDIYTVLKCAVVIILGLLLVIICLLIVILVNNIKDQIDIRNETSTSSDVTCDENEGWFDLSEHGLGCLLFHGEGANFAVAKEFCSDRGANHIEVETEKQMNIVRNFLKQIKSTSTWWWGGAIDEKTEAEWVWTLSGKPVENWAWHPDHPPRNETRRNLFTFNRDRNYFGRDCSPDCVCATICQKF